MRTSVLLFVFFTITVLFALTACGQPEVQPLRMGAVPWQAGETSAYEITDRNGAYAGTAVFELQAGNSQTPADGWTIHYTIIAQGAQEESLVEVSGDDLRPTASSWLRTVGPGQERAKAVYANGQVSLELTTKQEKTTYEQIHIPTDAREEATIWQLLRTLPLADGYATEVNSFLPVADLLERVRIEVDQQEEVQTPLGVYTTWLVTLTTNNRESQAWIAQQPPYMLVKFVDGHSDATFALREYRAEQ